MKSHTTTIKSLTDEINLDVYPKPSYGNFTVNSVKFLNNEVGLIFLTFPEEQYNPAS